MRQCRTGRMPWARVSLLLAGLAVAGCHSTTAGKAISRAEPAPTVSKKTAAAPAMGSSKTAKSSSPAALVLAQGMEVSWSLQGKADKPGTVRAGRVPIGPDGAVVLGPYGSCKVAGLTVEQARRSVEKHLARHVKRPTVRLEVAQPERGSPEVAWKRARNGGEALAALGKPAPGHGSVQRVTWQPQDGKDPGPLLAPSKDEELPPPRPLGRPTPMTTGPVVGEPVPGIVLPPTGMPVPSVHPTKPIAPNEMKRVLLPPYVIGISDVLLVQSLQGLKTQPVSGSHYVRPDGTIGLGIYGSARVAGLTLEQARIEVSRVIFARLESGDKQPTPKDKDVMPPAKDGDKEPLPENVRPTFKDVVEGLFVDVIAYNSKVFYVITDGGGYGEQVYPFPYTGNETVLDAVGKIGGLPPVASKRLIWVARRTSGHGGPKTLPVDWVGVTQRGEIATNYQLYPGDRVYVHSDRVRRFDANLAKFLSPIERIFGVTLLGSQTVNSIRSGSVVGAGIR